MEDRWSSKSCRPRFAAEHVEEPKMNIKNLTISRESSPDLARCFFIRPNDNKNLKKKTLRRQIGLLSESEEFFVGL